MTRNPHGITPGLAAPVYPFSAIVGQERMKLALILNAIDPSIGGVLIRGEKGTAKSTAVRALASLMPECSVFAGCAFACDPARPDEWCADCLKRGLTRQIRRRAQVVTLPLNATEDMVIGGIDFHKTIQSGRCAVQPGLLARAHRGILYVDEVNLLDDHLVDLVLDSAASGENIVEREGISFRHATRFALVGTMNPEEGGLRPQLLDRFGLCVEVASERDPVARVDLMERRERFELYQDRFVLENAGEEAKLARRLSRARDLRDSVRMTASIRSYIGELAVSRHAAGHRADLVIESAARAHAAWNRRDQVNLDDVLAVAEMALSHRSREAASPPQPQQSPPKDDKTDSTGNGGDQAAHPEPQSPPKPEYDASTESDEGGGKEESRAGNDPPDQLFPVGPTFSVKKLAQASDRLLRRGSGRRLRTRTSQKQGRYIRSRTAAECRDLALDATLRAAAPFQPRRRDGSHGAVVILKKDWREKVREKRIGSFILFIVDASGSMGSRGRMAASKGAIMSLLLDAYQKRDRVAMTTFRRREASLLLPPTSSIEVVARLLKDMPVGGRTPLSAGLVRGYETLMVQIRREPSLRPLAMLITDGKSNVPLSGETTPMEESLRLAGRLGRDTRIHWIVVDTEETGIVRFELARRIAEALGGEYFRIDDLRAADLLSLLKGRN